jgi:hypothetical protein
VKRKRTPRRRERTKAEEEQRRPGDHPVGRSAQDEKRAGDHPVGRSAQEERRRRKEDLDLEPILVRVQ